MIADSMNAGWPEALKLIKASHRTPFYVFLGGIVRENIAGLRRSLVVGPYAVRFFYSIKTNRMPFVLTCVQEANWDLLASSEQDLGTALDSKSRRILFDAPVKRHSCPERVDKRIVNVLASSVDLGALTEGNDHLQLGLRIAIPSSISGHVSRFGFDWNQLRQDTAFWRDISVTRFGSLHFHFGFESPREDQFASVARFAGEVWSELAAKHISIAAISFGGGIPGSASSRYLKESGEAIATALAFTAVPSSVEVWFEPGRSVVENAGAFCATVADITQREGTTFVMLDGGSNQIMPQWMLGKRSRHVQAFHHSASMPPQHFGPCVIVGPLCAETDVIGNWVATDGVSVGDVLMVFDVGAYDWSTQYKFGTDLPTTYVVDDSQIVDTLLPG